MFNQSCVSPSSLQDFGIQSDYQSYIPSRIAVMPCEPWPSRLRFEGLPLTNASDKDTDELCDEFDKKILEGFKNQPYMKGYSTKAVSQLLNKAGQSKLLQERNPLWTYQSDDCHKCKNLASFYSASIASRLGWRQWLNSFSQSTRNSDGILLPFVTFMAEKTFNDRGIIVASRKVGIAMLLIDSNNGLLIWAGQQAGELRNQKLEGQIPNQSLEYPPWSDINRRLFTEGLWVDFPGRQTL
jgi:hypothetical protein